MRRKSVLALVLLAASGNASAAAGDADFLGARDAYKAGNLARLERYADRLGEHPLAIYPEFWRMELRLDKAGTSEVRALLARHADTVLAERFRPVWLKKLGERGDWEGFRAEYKLVSSPDVELLCYALRARVAAGERQALAEARPLWLDGRESPAACTPLFQALRAEGGLSDDDVWQRVRVALQAGSESAARRASALLDRPLDGLALDRVAEIPQRYLERRGYDLKSRGDRELVLFALERIARSDPLQAQRQWLRVRDGFPPAEQAYLWGRLAYQAARRHDDHALEWFRLAEGAELSEEQLAWKARTALRAAAWQDLAGAIDAMAPAQQQDASWRYWKARALRERGATAEANAILAPLSAQFNFYGQLAREELGETVGAPAQTYRPSHAEVEAVARLPGIRRALELYRLDMRLEGIREWNYTVRGMDDRELLAAATLAMRHSWYDRAISTADRTVALHDFSLRFPAPHREVLGERSRELHLDEAWVYGLIRQESRFIEDARSSAGARGLMQLMPATAKWVARRMGMAGFSLSSATEVDTNVALGTYYLKHVLDTLDSHPVLASAAYNAGPMRAERWRPDSTPLEGAAYAESIPFNETRDYVKKVMSNATYYASMFRRQADSLRVRLGMVPPRNGGGDAVARDQR